MTGAQPVITASVLVIGDEILSGRTQDVNVAAIARFLGLMGIDLREARFVPDVEDEIVAALNALRQRYTYVFTTGGIGPTHDDITTDAVARAFGVRADYHPEALAMLEARYRPGEFNEARRRMARIPDGATLIRNSVSVAPGFYIGNVFVLAGVPRIMQAMLEDAAAHLTPGVPVISRTVTVGIPEGTLAAPLGAIQARHPSTAIGSYPFFSDGAGGRIFGTTLVVRGRDAAEVEAAHDEIQDMARSMGSEPKESRSG